MMSDDRKRNARLQGKFSDPKESRSGRRDKEKKTSHNQNSENNEENKKSLTSKSRTAGGINLEYREDSKHSFPELLEKKRILEIREKGEHVLSITENGSSRIIYEPSFMTEDEASELFIILRDSTTWYDKNIIIHGQEYPQPRLVSWFGPFPYTYSGATLEPAEMTSAINRIKERIERTLKMHDLHVKLNSVLLNLYRNGKDSVAWHSDDELTMGVQPTIASVSLGEIRAFQMRPKAHVKNLDPETRYQVNLLNGSLLIMDGCMQKDWQHQVPKEYHDKQPRINLTFRTVYHIQDIPTEVPYSIPEPVETVASSIPTPPPPKPIYDSDNFPPLGLASNPKRNVSYQTNSVSQNTSLHQKNITKDNTKSASENESAIEPIESYENPVINASSISNKSTLNELVNDATAKDEVEPKSTGEGSLCPDNRVVDSSTNNLEAVDEPVCTGGKHKLNVNAPDFVPIGHFSEPLYTSVSYNGLNLRDLADHHSKDSDGSCESDDFVTALIRELEDAHRNREHFQQRDWFELEVYIKLIEGGQSSENRRIIIKRIVTIINNSGKYYPRKSVPARTSRGRSSNFRAIYRH